MLKPRKKIELYHLGHAEPVAQFGNNEDEALFCLQQLNLRLVKQTLSVKQFRQNRDKAIETTLINGNFYYLTGENKKDYVHYVDIAPIDRVNVADKPAYIERIMEVDGDRTPSKVTRKPPGGRNNSENRHSDESI